MRIIIKPAGLAVIVLCFGSLAMFAFMGRQSASAVAPTPSITPAIKTAETDGVTSNIAPLAPSQTQNRSLRAGEKELLSHTNFDATEWMLADSTSGGAEDRVVDSDLSGFPKLRRATIHRVCTNPWDMEIRQTINAPIPAGTHLHLRVWARSKTSHKIFVVCEQNKDPYDKLAIREFILKPHWQQIDMEWTANNDLPADWAQVDIQIGGEQGEIDIAGASLTACTITR